MKLVKIIVIVLMVIFCTLSVNSDRVPDPVKKEKKCEKVDWECLKALESLKALENLDISLEGLEALESFRALEGLKALEGLRGLEALKGLEALESLDINLEGLQALEGLEADLEAGLSGLEALKNIDIDIDFADIFWSPKKDKENDKGKKSAAAEKNEQSKASKKD